MIRNKQIVWVYIIFALTITKVYAAPLTIEITQGIENATPIAIVPFGIEGVAPPADLASIVSNDLERSGLFRPLPARDMLSKPKDVNNIKFQNWRLLDIEHLVVGTIRSTIDNRYEATFWITDVFKGQIPDKKYIVKGSKEGFRAIAHGVSDIIYKEITGVRGAFSTHLSYVTAKGVGKSRKYMLWTSDADNENALPIHTSFFPIMSPSWSPDGTKIAYSSLENNGSQLIIVQGVFDSTRITIGNSSLGLFGAPSWSPDGKQLAMHVIKDGNSEVYVINLATKKRRQLTRHWAIDTEPVWTPDGKSIIFTSDRGGRPQLYRMSAKGGRAERLTFEGKENSRAAISPDGKLVAMAHRGNGKFQIAVMELESRNLRVLTDGALDESPSFAPNGSMIIYATTVGERGVLATVSVDGQFRQKLSSQDDVREPAWSPFNKK